MEIGRITTISIKCKDCGKVFVMGRRELRWYSSMGFPLPKHCQGCRKRRRKEAREHEKKANAAAQEQFLPFKGDIICKRTSLGPVVNIPHCIVKHSPDGFEWGYGGSGPADLALNALAAYIGREAAGRDGLYQEFKWDFIAPMSFRGGTIKREDVAAWLAAKGIEMPAE